MKGKIILQFLASLIVTILLSMFLFMVLNIFLLYGGSPEDLSLHSRAGQFTTSFGEKISIQNGQITVENKALQSLQKEGLWLQVLDESGTEIYSQYKPKHVPKHYTVGEVIFSYKFTGGIKGYTIYGGMLQEGERNLSYLIGFPENKVAKYTFNFSPETIFSDVTKVLLRITAIFLLLALILGYFFSVRLTKPIIKVIEGIQALARGNYSQRMTAKGLYASVLHNVNDLASELQKNEQ